MIRRRERYRLGAVLLLLAVLHFAIRPWMGDPRIAPDFLLLALLVYAIRVRPGLGAGAGFAVGLVGDALTPVAFGSSAMAHTTVGYLAGWGKAVFFPDNVAVNAGFFLGGAWLRDVLVLLGSGQVGGAALLWEILVWAPLGAISTALMGVLVMVSLGKWLSAEAVE
jgi:rod shape-determining protein MreD